MALPIIGAKITFREGPLRGQHGYIESVKDWRTAVRSLGRAEVAAFCTRVAQDLGPNWQSVWFEARVRSESGRVLPDFYGPRDLAIEPDGYRPDPTHSQR